MYLIPSKKLIFLAQPRTGSTSIAAWLTRTGLGEIVNGNPSWPKDWGDHHGVDPITWRRLEAKGWKSFCFVRNHWDYAVSFFFEHRRDRKTSFENFLLSEFEDMTWHRPQTNDWETRGKLFWCLPNYADEIYRYEELDTVLPELFGDDYEDPGNVNPSPREPYWAYYTDSTRAWIDNRYWREIKEWGYEYGPKGVDA